MIKYLKKYFVTYFELTLLFITVFYNFQHFALLKIDGNAASRVLLAVGPIFNIGIPYKELYEFVPPGFLILVSGWIRFFGISMQSFRLLHVFFIFLSGLFVLVICKKIFRRKIVELFVFSAIILSLHSGIVQTDLFSIDFLGTIFAVGGLAALLYFKEVTYKLAIGSTLILIASQIKDIYILPILSLIPIYFRELLNRSEKSFFKLLFLSLLGPLLIAILVLYYLLSTGALEGYIQVVRDKSAFAQFGSLQQVLQNFGAMIEIFSGYFLQLPRLMEVFMLGYSLFIILIYLKKLKTLPAFKFRNFLHQFKKEAAKLLKHYAVTFEGQITLSLVYITSLLFGLTLYGQYSVDTRFSAIVFSLFLLLGLLVAHTIEVVNRFLKQGFFRILMIFILLILLIPKQAIFRSYNFTPRHKGDYNFEVEKEIERRTNKDDCILHVYGWGVASTYIYTKRQPCSKYFLPNSLHQVGRQRLASEYRKEIFNSPPAAIILTTQMTDFDIARFEREVLNLSHILTECYYAEPKYSNYRKYFAVPITLYWPKNSDKRELKACVMKYGQPL